MSAISSTPDFRVVLGKLLATACEVATRTLGLTSASCLVGSDRGRSMLWFAVVEFGWGLHIQRKGGRASATLE